MGGQDIGQCLVWYISSRADLDLNLRFLTYSFCFFNVILSKENRSPERTEADRYTRLKWKMVRDACFLSRERCGRRLGSAAWVLD